MNADTIPTSTDLDPAAVFAGALSLWNACWQAVDHNPSLNLSEAYHGGDEFMRQIMRVASLFENWCADKVEFEQLDEVWPYLLEDRFGDACLELMGTEAFSSFGEADCFRVAMHLTLPIKVLDGLSVPVNLNAEHPDDASPFKQLQIRSVRRCLTEADQDIRQYTIHDDPEDPEFSDVFYGLYGLDVDGIAEHIADRSTYKSARILALKIAPGVDFPEVPTLLDAM